MNTKGLHNLRIFLIFLFSLCDVSLQGNLPKRAWTFLVFVQSNNDLNSFAVKNLRDMARIGSNENVNILVQWMQPEKKGAWRYKVTKDKVELDEVVAENPADTCVEDVVSAMKWASTKYPADHYAYVLWNHGSGVLDPNNWVAYRFGAGFFRKQDLYQISIPGVTTEGDGRGILFDFEKKRFMNNQQLLEALSAIRHQVLGGKKIDLLGMDACLMSMLEIGYQVRDFADILVASQEVEPGNGWWYSAFLSTLAARPLSSFELAGAIVSTYADYYKSKIPFYTQAAVNLEGMNFVKENIDQFVMARNEAHKHFGSAVDEAIHLARLECLQFSTSSYVDLYSFYEELLKVLDSTKFLHKDSSHPCVSTLKSVLDNGKALINQIVLASVSGQSMSRARGVSIYFPLYYIDASYSKTEFAKNSLWYELIKELARQKNARAV